MQWRRFLAGLTDYLSTGPFGDPERLVPLRRAYYRMGARLADANEGAEPGPALPDLLCDDPLFRLAVQRFLDLNQSDALEAWREALEGGREHHLLSRGAATRPHVLSRAWDEDLFVAVERTVRHYFSLQRQGWVGKTSPENGGDETGTSTTGQAEAAWLLLTRVMPKLTRSLAPHVRVIHWLEIHSASTFLKSGTIPELPGVILLSSTGLGTSSELVRALLHEACHAKFFDICLTTDVLGSDNADVTVSVPWGEETELRSRKWPLDQALAAAHAY